jgi:predicted dithiol-disulfide oxidoreductase (DUF899 family)
MVEVDAGLALTGPGGPLTLLEAFEGRRQLIAYYFMWNVPGRPAAEQCEGCTWVTTQVTELSYLHSRDITYAVLCQGGYDESIRYRDFMGWDMPWYSAQDSLGALFAGRQIGLFQLACYLRDGNRVFETYWTNNRGGEVMDYSYALMDLTVYGRQEPWEDSPPGWPQQCSYTRTNGGSPAWPPVSAWPQGRPIAQWSRLEAGRSAAHPGRPVLRRPARPGGRSALFVPAVGTGCRSARAISSRLHGGDNRVRVAATGMEDQHGVAGAAVSGSGCRGVMPSAAVGNERFARELEARGRVRARSPGRVYLLAAVSGGGRPAGDHRIAHRYASFARVHRAAAGVWPVELGEQAQGLPQREVWQIGAADRGGDRS